MIVTENQFLNKTNNYCYKFRFLLIAIVFVASFIISYTVQPLNEVKAFSSGDFTINSDGEITKIGDFDKSKATSGDNFKPVIDKYKEFIVGIGSFATVTMVLFFILNITKIAAAAGNPQARSQAIAGVVWTGVAVALLGSVTIWFGFFYGSLRGTTKIT